jgi:hypothetical protein
MGQMAQAFVKAGIAKEKDLVRVDGYLRRKQTLTKKFSREIEVLTKEIEACDDFALFYPNLAKTGLKAGEIDHKRIRLGFLKLLSQKKLEFAENNLDKNLSHLEAQSLRLNVLLERYGRVVDKMVEQYMSGAGYSSELITERRVLMGSLTNCVEQLTLIL